MNRRVCFFDEKDGQVATCLAECIPNRKSCNCEQCDLNPFPGKVIPEDRVLRNITFDPLV